MLTFCKVVWRNTFGTVGCFNRCFNANLLLSDILVWKRKNSENLSISDKVVTKTCWFTFFAPHVSQNGYYTKADEWHDMTMIAIDWRNKQQPKIFDVLGQFWISTTVVSQWERCGQNTPMPIYRDRFQRERLGTAFPELFWQWERHLNQL